MLYDCFSFYQEKELLDLRLHYLYDVVDKFVIVEGDRTFAGKPIPCFFDTIRQDYDWCKDKIIHVRCQLKENPTDRWENEAIQRNAFEDGLVGAAPDDLVLISCVDEIPRKEVLAKYKQSDKNVLTLFILDNFYYYLNGKDIGEHSDFPSPVLTRRKNITAGTHALWENRRWFKAPDLLEGVEAYDKSKYYWIGQKMGALEGHYPEQHAYPETKHAGWHFSYLGGANRIKQKLESFSHAEYDTDYYKDRQRIEQTIATGGDLFGRPDHEFEYVPITEGSDFPDYLIANKKKFREFIL